MSEDRGQPQVEGVEGDDEEGGGARVHVPLEAKVALASEVASRLFALLGGTPPSVESRAEDEQVVVALGELDPALCPPGDTRVLESLQFILSKAINRNSLQRTRLSLDAEGFRRRRPEGLDKLAAALAAKAQQLGLPLAVGPLPHGDLRFLGSQLQRVGGISVQTIGGYDRRRLVVQPTVKGDEVESGEGEERGESGQGRRRRRRRR